MYMFLIQQGVFKMHWNDSKDINNVRKISISN